MGCNRWRGIEICHLGVTDRDGAGDPAVALWRSPVARSLVARPRSTIACEQGGAVRAAALAGARNYVASEMVVPRLRPWAWL